MATHGEIPWPPVRTFDGRLWGDSHGRRHEDPTVYVVTFTGPVVLQLAGTSLPDLTFDDVVYPQLDAARIWPASASVVQRQRNVMTHKTLRVFTTAIYDDLNRRSFPAPPPPV
jgi:hypothetical protein